MIGSLRSTLRRRRAALLAAASLFIASLATPLTSKEFEQQRVFTAEEQEIRRELREVFDRMGARAHVLPGTRLYLSDPFRSKYYNVNSLGLRGPEVQPKKKNGFNVMVMGASTVFGETTKADNQTIPALLERRLKESHPDRAVTVYNVGVPGYEFQREIDLAKRMWSILEPDLIIFYTGGNNVHVGYAQGYARIRPFTRADETTLLAKKSENYYVFYRMLRQIAVLAKPFGGADPRQIEANLADLVRGFAADAVSIDRYFQNKKIPVVFVFQPVLATKRHKTDIEVEIVRSNDRPGLDGFYRSFIREFKASKGVERLDVHDFTDAFDGLDEGIFYDTIHVNLAGNVIIADRLCELIEKKSFATNRK